MQIPSLDRDESGYVGAICPIDYKTVGLITSYEMYQTMVKPLEPGVRLTAVFDNFYNHSLLDLPYVYSVQGVLKSANFSSKATQGVLAKFSSNARRILRNMASSSSFKVPKLPDSDLQALSKVTKTSPADVVVFHSAQHSDADWADSKKWSTAQAFFQAHRYNRQDSYSEILARMEAQVPVKSSIKPRISSCHPLGTYDLNYNLDKRLTRFQT